jgi:basic membrane protein A
MNGVNGLRRVAVAAAAAAVMGVVVVAGGSAIADPPQFVGVGYDGPRGEDVWGEAAVSGARTASDDFGIKVRTASALHGMGQAPQDHAAVIERLSSGQVDLVIGVGFPFADAVGAAAQSHQNINYALVDGTYPTYPDNLTGLVAATNEGSFLVGAAAAMKSSGEVGFIGATDVDVIEDFRLGYVDGVQMADPNTTIRTEYIAEPGDYGGFANPDRAYELAMEMYSSGVDVIFPPAGGSTIGVTFAARDFTLATGQQVWMIGVDSDLYATLPITTDAYASLQPYVLTSMVKNIDVMVYGVVRAQVTGTFMSGTTLFDLADEGVDYATSGGFVDDVVPVLEQYRQDIIDGVISVPTVRP